MSYTVLHALSGGVDSTSVLHQLLEAGEKPLVYHMDFGAVRSPREKRAVEEILNHLEALHAKVECRTFRVGNMPGVYDIETAALATGGILRREKTINRTTISTSLDDRALGNWEHRHENRTRIVEMLANRPIEWIAPNRTKSRSQVVREMPPELLALCSFCRAPKGNGKRCGRCHACAATLPILKGMKVCQ